MPWVSFQSLRFCSNSLQFCSRECSCIRLAQPRNCSSWFHFPSTSVLPLPSPRWHHPRFPSLIPCELITAFLPNLHLHKRAILRLQAHFNAQTIKTNWKLKKLQSHAKSYGETALKCVGAWQTAVETGRPSPSPTSTSHGAHNCLSRPSATGTLTHNAEACS